MSTAIDSMFDPPGPRGARRSRVLGALSLLAFGLVAAFFLYRFHQAGGLATEKWSIFRSGGVLKLVGSGLWATLRVAATAAVIALVLGVALAMLRMSRFRAVRTIVTAYIEVTRSLPTLLVLYFTVLFLPYYGIRMPVYWQLAVALIVTNGAMIAELVRASLLSVPKGQTEATMSLGLTRRRALQLVVLPQALRASTPALIAQLVYLLKGSTLGYVISYAELLYNGRVIGEYTGDLLQSFLVVTAIFLVVNISLSQLALALQRRLTSRGAASAEPLAATAE